MLFNGFIIHIDATYLCSNQINLVNYLQLLSREKYILILIHHIDDEIDDQTQSIIKSITEIYSNCQIDYLPNAQDNKEKIDEVREKLFHNAVQLQSFDEKTTQEHLKRLMDKTEKDFLEQDRDFINSIRSVLIDGKEENYLLYSLFTDLCQKKLKVSQMDRYGDDIKCDTLYKLHLELFCAEADFKKRQDEGSLKYGNGFEMFLNLLEEPKSRLAKLNLLSMELKKEALKKSKDEKALQFYEQLSLEIHWRNIIIGSSSLTDAKQEIVFTSYRDYIIEGNPFEIVDGDNFEMQDTFLSKVFELFPNKKFFIITTIGPENSGKSTLLNFLFGTLFEARDGRCTKGKN
jgi:hypothetical protein